MTFSEQKAIFLFRMFQEALNNILKHSKASRLDVIMDYEDDRLEMEIRDNGVGFDLPAKQTSISSGSGVGLRSLYNRASIIGAELLVNSEPGKGTRISIKLPYELD